MEFTLKFSRERKKNRDPGIGTGSHFRPFVTVHNTTFREDTPYTFLTSFRISRKNALSYILYIPHGSVTQQKDI